MRNKEIHILSEEAPAILGLFPENATEYKVGFIPLLKRYDPNLSALKPIKIYEQLYHPKGYRGRGSEGVQYLYIVDQPFNPVVIQWVRYVSQDSYIVSKEITIRGRDFDRVYLSVKEKLEACGFDYERYQYFEHQARIRLSRDGKDPRQSGTFFKFCNCEYCTKASEVLA